MVCHRPLSRQSWKWRRAIECGGKALGNMRQCQRNVRMSPGVRAEYVIPDSITLDPYSAGMPSGISLILCMAAPPTPCALPVDPSDAWYHFWHLQRASGRGGGVKP